MRANVKDESVLWYTVCVLKKWFWFFLLSCFVFVLGFNRKKRVLYCIKFEKALVCTSIISFMVCNCNLEKKNIQNYFETKFEALSRGQI